MRSIPIVIYALARSQTASELIVWPRPFPPENSNRVIIIMFLKADDNMIKKMLTIYGDSTFITTIALKYTSTTNYLQWRRFLCTCFFSYNMHNDPYTVMTEEAAVQFL